MNFAENGRYVRYLETRRRNQSLVQAGSLPRSGGWTRTFLLYSDGFSKEMDINSAVPISIPLPFHGMSVSLRRSKLTH